MKEPDQASLNKYLLEQLKRLSETQEFFALQWKDGLQRIAATQEVLIQTQRSLAEFELCTTVLLGTILAEAADGDSTLLDRLTIRMDAHIFTHGDDENVCKAVQKAQSLLRDQPLLG